MKRRIVLLFGILLLMCFTVSAYAAAAPEGFVGVIWGASRSQVKQMMLERGWTRYTDSSPNEEVFKGAFDGMAGDIHFLMAGDSFVEGYADPLARLPVRNMGATRSAYAATVKHLTEKYGTPQKVGVPDYHGFTQGNAVIWEFGDGVTNDRYTIRVIINSEGTWFSDVEGKQTYFDVVYEAISLRERLKNQNI